MELLSVMILPWLLSGRNPHVLVACLSLTGSTLLMGLGLILLRDIWITRRTSSFTPTFVRRRDPHHLHQGSIQLKSATESTIVVRHWTLPSPLTHVQAQGLLAEMLSHPTGLPPSVPELLHRVSQFIHACALAGGIGPIHRLFSDDSGLHVELVVDGGMAFVPSSDTSLPPPAGPPPIFREGGTRPLAIALLLYRLDQLQEEVEDPTHTTELFDLMEFMGGRLGGLNVLLERYVESPGPATLRALAWVLAHQAHPPQEGEAALIYDFLAEHWENDDISLQINCLTTVQRHLRWGTGWPGSGTAPLILLPFLQRCLHARLPVQLTALELLALLQEKGGLPAMGAAATLDRLRSHLQMLAGRGSPMLAEVLLPLADFMGKGWREGPGREQMDVSQDRGDSSFGARQP